MSSEVLYRKWRPRSLAEVAGQEMVVRTLTNAIAGDKVAHAYLFSGPRGTGKTTTGRLLAMAVNCSQLRDGQPCAACDSCQAYLAGRALDLIELDAASNRGIDEIRSLREKANFAPAGGVDAYKVYLVDEVHMLTEPAFNALLKTLEEPPPHVIFVLATTEAHKVPATVISRCQRFDFRRIPLEAAVGRLKFIAGEEGIECSEDALKQIARVATGSLRDAINLLEQLVDSYGNKLADDQVREGLGLVVDARSVTLAAHALKGELAEGLAVISEVRDDGLDLRQFQRQVVAQMRGLLLAKAGAELSESWSEEQIAEMRALVAEIGTDRIVSTLRAFGEADLRADPLSPLPLELALAGSILAAEAPASSGCGSASSSASATTAPEPAGGQTGGGHGGFRPTSKEIRTGC
ncbi:MAG: DNA polymerase III subunit gamma/tau [Chloroflexi bacterium]|nr:DNA polymerase III subunit gamma/tau [Chloroflexota bacterium]